MSHLSPLKISASETASNGSERLTTVHNPFVSGMTNDSYEEATTISCQGIYCHSNAFFHAATALTIFLALVGSFGNILTIVAILTSNLRNNINSILICNLSFSDAVYCTLLLPLQATAFYNKDWILGELTCELHGSVRIWIIGVNMTLLSCIAFYRFLHVVHPQTHTCLSLRPWFTVAVIFCWIFPFFFAFSPIVKWWGAFCFNKAILQCTFAAHASKSHKITSITLGYVIPCVFICVCYSRIGCVVFSSRKRSSRGSLYRRQRAKRESFRLTAMMLLIFLTFLVGTTPYFLINLLDTRIRYPAAHIWCPFLAWVMYSLTPIIYTVMDTKFQAAYRRLLLCQVKRTEAFNDTSCHERQSSPLTASKKGAPQ